MQIDVSNLVKSKSLAFSINDLLHLSKEYILLDYDVPIEMDGTVLNDNGLFLLTAVVKASLQCCCDNCLAPVTLNLEVTVSEKFAEYADADDIFPLVDWKIDAYEAALSAVLANFPMKLLCSEDCKGLCPTCGINKNNENCDCKKDNINPQFAALKGFFADKEV